MKEDNKRPLDELRDAYINGMKNMVFVLKQFFKENHMTFYDISSIKSESLSYCNIIYDEDLDELYASVKLSDKDIALWQAIDADELFFIATQIMSTIIKNQIKGEN